MPGSAAPARDGDERRPRRCRQWRSCRGVGNSTKDVLDLSKSFGWLSPLTPARLPCSPHPPGPLPGGEEAPPKDLLGANKPFGVFPPPTPPTEDKLCPGLQPRPGKRQSLTVPLSPAAAALPPRSLPTSPGQFWAILRTASAAMGPARRGDPA
eukprot:15464669-Alexandrium_andersonii.AAC.1